MTYPSLSSFLSFFIFFFFFFFFFGFVIPDLTFRIREYMFSSCTVPSDSKEIKLGSSNQETSPSTGENIRIVLLPFHAWKCFLSGIFGCVDIFDVPRYHLLRQMNSQWESQNLLQGLVPHELTSHLSRGHKPENFESNNSLKFSFLNVQASSVK